MSGVEKIKEPLVSILITAYNREKYIAAAIDSVLQSSYQNFELIIVDDCSSDNSFHIAQRYLGKDQRIRLYRNEENLGQFQNRNKAISFAKGDFIKFLDSDDAVEPNGLQVMIESMQKYPEAGIGVPVQKSFANDVPCLLGTHESVLLHYKGENHLCYGPTATIFRRNIFKETGMFEPAFGILADTLFNIKAASMFPTVLFAKDLVFWRRHDDQVTEEQKDDARMVGERDRIMKASLAYAGCPLTPREKNTILNNFIKINSIHFFKRLVRGRFGEAGRVWRQTQLSVSKIWNAVTKNVSE